MKRERLENENKNRLKNRHDQNGKKTKSSTGGGFYYSFLTVILLLCLFQITVSAVLNISKIVSYKAKIIQISKTRDEAMARNEMLKDNIKNFSNVAGLEEIARNNLKMSGEDEVLVIINTPKVEDESEEKQENGFWAKRFHNFGG